MLLRELFGPDKVLPITWNNAHQAQAFLPDERRLLINFISHGNRVFAIEFSVGGDFEMTGMGGTAEIFSTVIETIKTFIKHERGLEGGALFFTADEKSRAKMYDTLAKRTARAAGWHVVPYEEVAQDERLKTAMSYGDFLFVIEPGHAPEHRQAAQKPQHAEFLPVYYTYSREDENAPIYKIRARSSAEAEEYVMKHVPEYKGLNSMGLFATKTPMPYVKDLGTVPKPEPKRQPTPLEQALRNKLGA